MKWWVEYGQEVWNREVSLCVWQTRVISDCVDGELANSGSRQCVKCHPSDLVSTPVGQKTRDKGKEQMTTSASIR